MLDIGFMEILVIGAIALIVVGPKDLPGLLRTVGQYAGKARAMARDFQRTMDEAAREADLGDVADVVKGKKNNLPFGNQVVDSLKEFEKTVKTEVTDAARAAEGAVADAKKAADAKDAVAAANAAAAKGFTPPVDAAADTAKVETPAEPAAKPAAKPADAPEAKSA